MKTFLNAKNSKITGRVYFAENAAWTALSGCSLKFKFHGKRLAVTLLGDKIALHTFTDGEEYSHARAAVYVNGERVIDTLVDFVGKRFEVISSDCVTDAEVEIIKLSEAAMSALGVGECETDDDAVISPCPYAEKKIEFIGDSITCGYGVDDEDENHGFSTATEDVTKAYAYKTAKMLGADYSMFSSSGYGIISGYTEGDEPLTEETLPQYYESYGFSRGDFAGVLPETLKWDFAASRPDLIVINLGTNDDSYCLDYGDRQQAFIRAYADFLHRVRKLNPDVPILCTVGIMGTRIFASVKAAAELYKQESGDTLVDTLCFDEQNGTEDGYAANWHPTERTHQKAAEKLSRFLLAGKFL